MHEHAVRFSMFAFVAALPALGGCHADPPDAPRATPTQTATAAIPTIPSATATSTSSPKPSRGDWTLMHFLGGPPERGQITDTLHVDPAAAGRHVRLERNRAGASDDRVCEVEADDDAAWAALIAALGDADLEAAIAHSDRMPGLVIDTGYFACTHGGVRVAVSDMRSAETHAARETAALYRLSSAYGSVVAAVIAKPACAPLK